MWNGFVKGRVKTNPFGATVVTIYVDELFKNNTPYVDFWHFCMLRNLVLPPNPESDNPDIYRPAIDYLYLIKSQKEERNQLIYEMCCKYELNEYGTVNFWSFDINEIYNNDDIRP
jgi:hypothetical protein